MIRPLDARRRAAVLAVVAATLLSSCSAFGGDQPELPAAPLPSDSAGSDPSSGPMAAFYGQEIPWRACRGSMECGTLEVPLDYAAPRKARITLSLLRVPASDKAHRVGALVVNPGGPGASGVEYAARADSFFGSEVRAAFDIVGFDPRGVGKSTPIDCLDDADMDTYIASDPDPDSPAEARESDALLRDFGQGCLDISGDLTRHVSTVEAAKDMDILRAALGQPKMAYFGASYGTFLGATYAELFPQKVGRMVLDGAVDPSLGVVETSLVQAEGFETALRAYVANCVADGDCYLGDSVDAGVARVRRFLDDLDAEPIRGDARRQLTEGLGVLGIWAPLYDRSAWSLLDTALSRGLRGDGSVLLSFADQYVGRGPEGYVDNSTEALYAVNCLDHDEAISLGDVAKYEKRFEKASPTFGSIFAFGLTACGSWPVRSGGKPEPIEAKGAAPILVVGTTRDPATPLGWAKALAAQLDSGVLVTRDGDGHTGYYAGNKCVDSAVEKYLVSGAVPKADVTC